MSSVNFLEAMETLKSMFPELDTVTVRDVLDKHGGFMEGAVEELLGISRAKRGMGGGRGIQPDQPRTVRSGRDEADHR